MSFDIIAIGYRPWTHAESVGVNVRDLHLATRLAADPRVGKVLYISRPVSAAERLLRRTPWRSAGTPIIETHTFGLYAVADYTDFYVLCIKSAALFDPILKGRCWWEEALLESNTQLAIGQSIEALGISPDVLLNWVPFASRGADIPARVKAFDVIDNFAKHQRIRTTREIAHCLAGYDHVAENYDLITSVSSKAAKIFGEGAASKVNILRNGVPSAVTQTSFECPHDLSVLIGPIVGTGGNFFEKFNVRFLVDLANAMPDVNFVMIGKILLPSIYALIKDVSNIHYFGQKHYNQAMAYYYHFDVGFMFYEMEKENDGDPLKLFEFLAAGTPMVTLPSMGVEQREGVIEVVDSVEHCAERIRKLLQISRSDRRTSCRASLVHGDFWESKAGQLAGMLESHLALKSQSV